MPQPGRRLGLGPDPGEPGRGRAPRARRESAEHGARRDLQRADARIRRARRRHRQQGRRVGVARRAATWAASIAASARVRSTARRRRAITARRAGRFHQYPGPGFQGIGENSAESSYYSWVDQHNTFGLGNDVPMSTGNLNDGLIAFARRPDGRAARALSDGLLRQGLRRAHRRSESWLEGTRAVGGQRRSHAVADRGRQGHAAARRALPVAAGSAREVVA